MHRFTLILQFLLLSLVSEAQIILSSDAQISLLTCDPGSELYSTFGHTAIRVKDPEQKLDVAFNYGIFDFDTPGFYSKFLRGKLDYMLGAYPYDSFMHEYRRDKRSVTEQVLLLDSLKKQTLFDFLANNAKKENRYYKYDFFFDNCSTRPRDVFESVMDLQLDKADIDKSFRDLLDEFLPGMPWADFGIDLVIGAVADQKATEYHQTFLPEYLMTSLDQKEGFVANKKVIIDHSKEREERFKASIFSPTLLFGLLLLLELIFLLLLKSKESRWINLYDKTWFIIMAFSSIVLLFMWFGTDHIATKQNWNLLWISPAYVLIPLIKDVNRRKQLFFFLLGSNILAVVSWTLIPQNYHQAFLPIMLIMIIKLWRHKDKQNKIGRA